MVLSKSQSLPFIPGCVPYDLSKLGPNQFRSQTLQFRLGDSGVAVDKKKATIATDRMDQILAQITDPSWRFQHSGEKVLTGNERKELLESQRNTYQPRVQPAWMKHARQVLRFEGYFQEKIEENAYENARFRHCVLLCYLEDGTMQINEPRVENSGIPQGAFLKRHVFPHAHEDRPIMWWDLHPLGGVIEIYGKVFHITKCDDFTKWFAAEAGMELGEEIEAPKDLYTVQSELNEKRRKGELGVPRNVREGKKYNECKLGGPRGNDALEQFLKNDRKVLRFYCYWDDHTRYGTRQYQCITYYLADDSVQISDLYGRNSGRDPFPINFKRRQMPKKLCTKAVPGMLQKDPDYVMPQDLICGQFLEVLGKAFFLYDCDEFTKNFYKQFMGIEQVSYPKNVEDDLKFHQKLTPPPHNGPGTEEDSLLNCIYLQPPYPKADLIKLTTLDGKILRFEARCANQQVEDEDRKFIIGYFLANDTVACWELRQRNSGFTEGKFAERGRKVNPATGGYYKPEELFVGAEVAISSMHMIITRADEYSLRYMEENPADFPCANVDMILQKLSAIKEDPEVQGMVSLDPDSFRNVVEQKTGVYLVDQELITLLRCFSQSSDEAQIGIEALLGSIP